MRGAEDDTRRARAWSSGWLVAAAAIAALITLGVAALLTNIFERQQEARDPFYEVVELNDTIVDPAVWGRNCPIQYDLYNNTVDMTRTRYGGSEAIPKQPGTCLHCHASTYTVYKKAGEMRLRVTRPGFIEGVHAFMGAALPEDFDVNEDATRAEMRTFVCAQCHVEYYFAGEEKRLTYPWANGLRADDALATTG